MNVTAEAIAAALQETADQPAPKPVLRFEIQHPGLDRKGKPASAKTDRDFRELLRTAAIVAKTERWPHRYSHWFGGTRVRAAEIQLVAVNSRRCGTTTESIIRFELGAVLRDALRPNDELRFRPAAHGLYAEADVVATRRAKDRGKPYPYIIVTVKAIEVERVPSWQERLESGEIGREEQLTEDEWDARRLPRSRMLCLCDHDVAEHPKGACLHVFEPAGVPCECAMFRGVRASFLEDGAQQRAEPEPEIPRVAMLQEPRSWDEIEDPDEREAAIAREMRGNHSIRGGSNDNRRNRDKQAKIDPATRDLGYQERIASGW